LRTNGRRHSCTGEPSSFHTHWHPRCEEITRVLGGSRSTSSQAWCRQMALAQDRLLSFADGYDRNVVGNNQDPCVFAAPLGPFHSFCRIDAGRGRDNWVREANGQQQALLPEVVSSGDIVIYGKFEPKGGAGPTACVWIDLVLAVDRPVPWPTCPRQRGLCNSRGRCPDRRFARDLSCLFVNLGLAASPASTDAYRYNLADAEPTGVHRCTGLANYQIILGVVSATPDSLTSITTSFAPLANRFQTDLCPAAVTATHMPPDDWSRLVTFIDGRVRPVDGGPRGGWIVEFPNFGLAEQLCRAVVTACGGEVAVPPFTPHRTLRRWDSVTRTYVPFPPALSVP
jgi:hypothetical protein